MKTRYLIGMFTASIIFGSFAYASYEMDSNAIINHMPQAIPKQPVPAYQLAAAEQQQEYPLSYQLPSPTAVTEQRQQNLFSNPTSSSTTEQTATTPSATNIPQAQTTSQIDETYIPNSQQKEVNLPKKAEADIAPSVSKPMTTMTQQSSSSRSVRTPSVENYQPQSFQSAPVPIYFNTIKMPDETIEPAATPTPVPQSNTTATPVQSTTTQE